MAGNVIMKRFYLVVTPDAVANVIKVKLMCIKLVTMPSRELDRPFSQLVVELLLRRRIVHGTVSKVLCSIGN